MRLLVVTLMAWAFALPAHALQDLAGRTVPSGDYRRIVSLAPSNTELVYAIGWGDRLIGVTDMCDYPPEARKKPRVGGAETLSVEHVLSLKPDLVLAIPSKAPALRQLARMLKAPVVVLESDTLESVAKNAEALGAVVGPEGKAFAARYRRDLARIEPAKTRPSVFYLVWDRPLMTAGPGTFLDDLIRRAGGRNVALEPGYRPFSEERLIASAPQVVLYPSNLQPAVARLRARVPRARFVALPADEVSRPGPRVLPAIRQAAGSFK